MYIISFVGIIHHGLQILINHILVIFPKTWILKLILPLNFIINAHCLFLFLFDKSLKKTQLNVPFRRLPLNFYLILQEFQIFLFPLVFILNLTFCLFLSVLDDFVFPEVCLSLLIGYVFVLFLVQSRLL